MDEEILFHYTNEVGLQGILQNKCLWATDVFASNDFLEIELGNDLFVKNLQEWTKQNNLSGDSLKFLFGARWELLKGVFFVCFSTTNEERISNDGLLSQWRGYGSYAIKFKKNALSGVLKNWKQAGKDQILIADLDENVRYYSKSDAGYKMFQKDNSLKVEIDKFKQSISADYWIKIVEKLHKKEILSEEEDKKIRELMTISLIPSLFVKHNGFHEERERRIVILIPKNSDKKLHFHAPSKPHIKLFEEDPAIIENAVKEIIIGPMGDQKAAKNWVENMLREFGYRDDIKVKCSEIPFRKS